MRYVVIAHLEMSEREFEQIEALHASLDLTTRSLQSISQELAAVRAQLRPQSYNFV